MEIFTSTGGKVISTKLAFSYLHMQKDSSSDPLLKATDQLLKQAPAAKKRTLDLI